MPSRWTEHRARRGRGPARSRWGDAALAGGFSPGGSSPAPPALWDFDDIQANLTRWWSLRAEHSANQTINTGKVETLVDLSNAAAAYTQATDAKRPTYNATGFNGKPCMTGDGTADIALAGSTWADLTLISMVATDRMQFQTNSAITLALTSAAPTIACIIAGIWTTTGAIWRIDGAQVLTDAVARTSSGAFVAAIDSDGPGGGGGGRLVENIAGTGVLLNRNTQSARQWNGKFAEMAILDATAGVIGTVEKAEGKLAHYWWGAGVLNTLDAGHPYKTNPPTA